MKRLLVGAALLIILGIVTVVMVMNNSASTVRSELSNFALESPEEVTKIILKDQNGEQVILDKQDNHWTVNGDYKARPDAIKILLNTMTDLSIKSPVSQNAMQTIFKNIIAQHILVTVYAGSGDPVKEYYVGGSNQLHTGTNMMMKGSSRPFVMHIEGFHGFLTPRYFTNELEWRARDVFELSPEEIEYVGVSYSNTPEKNFMISKTSNGDREVRYGERDQVLPGYDTLMLNAYLNNYKMVHYESYEETKSEQYIDSVKQSVPEFIINLRANGQEQMVKGYLKPLPDGYDLEGNPVKHDQDRLYITVNDQDLFVAQYAIFDKLTKGVYFLSNNR
ncbi:MAG: hypothetical protein Salg2KO_07730 [Salibacteraceae bacterium]